MSSTKIVRAAVVWEDEHHNWRIVAQAVTPLRDAARNPLAFATSAVVVLERTIGRDALGEPVWREVEQEDAVRALVLAVVRLLPPHRSPAWLVLEGNGLGVDAAKIE